MADNGINTYSDNCILKINKLDGYLYDNLRVMGKAVDKPNSFSFHASYSLMRM